MLTSTAYPYEPRELVNPQCPNFFMYEIFKSDTADRMDIDNTEGYTDEHRELDGLLVGMILQPLRDIHGYTKINSWYRGEELEQIICAKSFERYRNINPLTHTWEHYFTRKSHPKGGTVDFEIPGYNNDNLFTDLQNNFMYDQCIREFRKANDPESGWVHVSLCMEPFENRQEALHRP